MIVRSTFWGRDKGQAVSSYAVSPMVMCDRAMDGAPLRHFGGRDKGQAVSSYALSPMVMCDRAMDGAPLRYDYLGVGTKAKPSPLMPCRRW